MWFTARQHCNSVLTLCFLNGIHCALENAAYDLYCWRFQWTSLLVLYTVHSKWDFTEKFSSCAIVCESYIKLLYLDIILLYNHQNSVQTNCKYWSFHYSLFYKQRKILQKSLENWNTIGSGSRCRKIVYHIVW